MSSTQRLSYTIALLLLSHFTASSLNAQTNLGAGDLMITLLNMEGNNDDAFGFVLLTDVAAGTVINFTDKEYETGAGFTESSEGFLVMTFNQAYPCGTEVIVTDQNPAADIYDFQAQLPGISAVNNDGQFQLSTAGETLIAYRGSELVSPCNDCFITALANTGVEFSETATGSGDLPPGLVIGTSAMAMTGQSDGDEWDNIKYNCITTQADPADLRTALTIPTNWTTDDAAALPTTVCGFACSAACITPVIESVTITDCSNGQNGSIVYQVNGQLNGAMNWVWRIPTEAGQVCASQVNEGLGGFFTATFSNPQWVHHVVATGGCLTEEVCFSFIPNELLGIPAFAPLNGTCETAGIQTGLGGAIPTGGTYSGAGVTDDGNGTTFSFNPAASGAGEQIITYTLNTPTNLCGETFSTQTINVDAAPAVSFVTGALVFEINAGIQTGLSGGTPTGGIYSGSGVMDDGNGMTYSFDPMLAGVGVIPVTYTFDPGNGCTGSASGSITVTSATVAGNECGDATDLNSLFGQPAGIAQTSALFNNNNATVLASDPTNGFDCFGEPDGGGASPSLENTLWYTFTGDGETYTIRTVECTATDYIDFGDSQIAVYSGDCGGLVPVICNEDAPGTDPNGPYPAEVTLATESGLVYRMLIDGFNGSNGEFCVQVTQAVDVAVTNIGQTVIEVYPNPATEKVQLSGVVAQRIDIFDHTGRLVASQTVTPNELDLAGLATGVYLLKIHTQEQFYSAKVVKQ